MVLEINDNSVFLQKNQKDYINGNSKTNIYTIAPVKINKLINIAYKKTSKAYGSSKKIL